MGGRMGLALGLVIVGGCVMLASVGLAALLLNFSSGQGNLSSDQRNVQELVMVFTFGMGLGGGGLAVIGIIIGVRSQKQWDNKLD
jgi:hypothetical protein